MNIDEIIAFVDHEVKSRSSRKAFTEELGIGINTFYHLKKAKNINLSLLIKILNKLNITIKLEKE